MDVKIRIPCLRRSKRRRQPLDPPTPPPLRSAFLHRAFAAFTYRDFSVLWFGAFTSTVGTWMQKVAQSWLVFELTKSSLYLGLDDFLGQLPILLFTIVGGVIADRHDRRQLLLGSQYIQMATAFTARPRSSSPSTSCVWQILALSFVAGFAQAFGGPAYQSLVPSLVHKKDLPNAIALNSIQFNLARVFGPLLSSTTMAAFGAAACFGLNGLSFLVVIVALMSLSVKHLPPAERKPMLEEMKGGFTYARSEPTIIAITVLASMTTFLGLPLLTFLPVFARDVFHGDVGTYSRMMSFSGAGAVVGALVVAWLGRFRHMGLTLLLVQVVFGALIAALRAVARVLAEQRAAVRRRRVPDLRVLDDRLAGAAARAGPPARPGHEHLHGGVPRRHAARQPGERLRRQPDVGAHTCSRSTAALVSLSRSTS